MKSYPVLRARWAVFVAVLAAVVSFTVPASAVAPAPQLHASSDWARPGQHLTITGTNYPAARDWTLFDGTHLTPVILDADGGFSVDVVMAEPEQGQTSIEYGLTHNQPAFSAPAIIVYEIPDPGISATVPQWPGAHVDLFGTGYTPGASYRLDGPDGLSSPDPAVAGPASSRGLLTFGLTLPIDIAAGSYPVSVVAVDGGQVAARGAVTVPPSIVSLFPGFASQGSVVDVSGSAFLPGETVDVRFTGASGAASGTVGTNGTFDVPVAVSTPNSDDNAYAVVTGRTSHRSAAAVLQALGAGLAAGTSLTALGSGGTLQMISSNNSYSVAIEAGRLALRRTWQYPSGPEDATYWTSGSAATAARVRLVMQTDGNLVIYQVSTGRALWSSRTNGTGSTNRLLVQDDGNLVIYSGNRAVWQTGYVPSILPTGSTLSAGGVLSYPVPFRMVMQTDGNLVIYKAEFGYYHGDPFAGLTGAVWSSGTVGRGNRLVMQTDGNLVIYSAANRALWSSRTAGTGSGNRLVMQTDGNLVVYTAAGRAVWASGIRGGL